MRQTQIEPDQAIALITSLAGLADYLVIDLPSYPSAANQAAIRHCDFVALVVEPEPACVTSAGVTLELLKSWGVSGGIVEAVVVNRAELAMDLREIRARLGCEIVGVVPPARPACLAAQERGTPLVLHQPESLAAISLTEIARRLAGDHLMVSKV